MQQSEFIVSMTSFPPRINGAAKVWASILRQDVDLRLYKRVLVLCETEFPNGLNGLPKEIQLLVKNKLIEIIWHKTNIKSHKKLIPTLLKYPNATVLVVDDDVIRPEGWLRCFMEDHKKHPNDVITGMVAQYLDGDHFEMYPNRAFGNTNYGTVIENGRPANGRGGTLYPAHTFTDPRFFDESLFMRLTPTSDESWQFYFNRRDKKPIRLISKQFDVSNFISGSQQQETALWKVNHRNNGYDIIWKRLKAELG